MDELLSGSPVFTASELTGYLRGLIQDQPLLQDLWVRGEVTSASLSRGGHLFFSLKDSQALVKCVAFAPASRRLHAYTTDGQEVLAHGRLDVYPAQGAYQLYVDRVVPIGVGLAYLEFERVKRVLQAEGLFAPERKRPLPHFPTRIGVVTSAFGAARHDIERVIASRWPCVELVLSPTGVQGEGAPAEIVAALQRIAREPVQLVLLARGGGAREDLSCFNSEDVARAIAAMPVPVITGIGHETDFTIADFVADLRAPTPSAAAAAAVPDGPALRREVLTYYARLTEAASDMLTRKGQEVEQQVRVLRQASPAHQIEVGRLGLDEAQSRLAASAAALVNQQHGEVAHLKQRLLAAQPRLVLPYSEVGAAAGTLARLASSRLTLARQQLESLVGRLRALDPAAILERGYVIVHHDSADGPIVRRAAALGDGQRLALQFHDGIATTTVDTVRLNEKHPGGYEADGD